MRGRVTSQDSVEGEPSWQAEHTIELDLLALSIAALIIGLDLPFLNGPYVDMMGCQAKLVLSVGVAWDSSRLGPHTLQHTRIGEDPQRILIR